tara:strand:- start:533 stop:760 length:228 start_codon:yes stop_codon:yes gene_type:complete
VRPIRIQFDDFVGVVVGEQELDSLRVTLQDISESKMVVAGERTSVELVLIGIEVRRVHKAECPVGKSIDHLLEIQ